jgi:hypothetical protein
MTERSFCKFIRKYFLKIGPSLQRSDNLQVWTLLNGSITSKALSNSAKWVELNKEKVSLLKGPPLKMPKTKLIIVKECPNHELRNNLAKVA